MLRALFLCKKAAAIPHPAFSALPTASPGRVPGAAGASRDAERRDRAPAALTRALSLGAAWHRNAFCHPARAGTALRAGSSERNTHLAGCPGQGPAGERYPGRLCPGAGAAAAPRPPVSDCSMRRRAPGPRSPGGRCPAVSRLPPSGIPRRSFIRGAAPEPRAAETETGTGQRRRRAVPALLPPPPGRSERRRARSGGGGRAGFKRRAVTPHKRFR